MKYEDVSEGLKVVTTRGLAVRRTQHGWCEEDHLAPGSLCTVEFEDGPGDFLLSDEDGDELWNVPPEAFEPAP